MKNSHVYIYIWSLFLLSSFLIACGSDDEMGTGGTDSMLCSDGILNGNETGIDCGGSCDDCQTFNRRIDLSGKSAPSGSIQTSDNKFLIYGEDYETDVLFISMATDQAELLWFKEYTTQGGRLTDAIECPNGDFLVVGHKQLGIFTEQNGLIIRIDKNGNTLWQEEVYSNEWILQSNIAAAIDGGYIITFRKISEGAGTKIIKIGEGGFNILWEQEYPQNQIQSIDKTSNRYIFGGATGSDPNKPMIMQTDINGNLLSLNTFGPTNGDGFISDVHFANNKILATGGVSQDVLNDYDLDIWVLETDLDGNINWEKEFPGFDWDIGGEVIKLNNGQIVTIGAVTTPNHDTELKFIKLDSSGNTLIDKSINECSFAHRMNVYPYGSGFLIISIVGECEESGGLPEVGFLQLDANGNF